MSYIDKTTIFDKYEASQNRVRELESAIKKHRDAKGHNSCWLNDGELYLVIGEKMPDRKLPGKDEFLKACEGYYDDQNK